jgi:hypothetical protein
MLAAQHGLFITSQNAGRGSLKEKFFAGIDVVLGLTYSLRGQKRG